MEAGLKFQKRIEFSEKHAERIFNEIVEMGFLLALNGIEHTHPSFNAVLNRSTDITSLMLRYAPDGVIAFGQPAYSCYIEVKAFTKSAYIEKDAYLNYMRIANDGGIVVIIYANDKFTLWNYIDAITFVKSKYVNNGNWPVDSDDWICPRDDRNWNIKKRFFSGSGTSYKCVNCHSLMKWDDFKESIKRKML